MKRLLRAVFRREEVPAPSPQLLESLQRQVDGARRTAIYDPTVDLYQRWYFELRLQEEITRATRYKLSFAVVCLRIVAAALVSESTISDEAIIRGKAAAAISEAIRSSDVPSVLGGDGFGICLVHCDRKGAETTAARLRHALCGEAVQIGYAVYPDDNCEARQLIQLALSRAT